MGPPIMAEIASRLTRHGGAAMIIDYGTWQGSGDSFQALRNHQPEDPLAHPGEADLTAHVDFAPLAQAAHFAGAQVSQMRHPGEWLLDLGMAARAARLTAAGDQGAAAALSRLTDAAEMGQLFKVLAIWSPNALPPPGFQPRDNDANHA